MKASKNKSLRKASTTVRRRLLCAVFPARCCWCGRVVDIRLTQCPECTRTLERISGEVCFLCAHLKRECRCGKQLHFYRGLAAPFYYRGAAGKAVRQLKFGKNPQSADVLARAMTECFRERLSDFSFDRITYVPLWHADEKKRGFNQAELLARRVAAQLGLPCEALLEKTVETQPQHFLGAAERTGNLLGVFRAVEGKSFPEERILLIDDVCTTGCTLNECAKTLCIAGAAEVICLTAAVA